MSVNLLVNTRRALGDQLLTPKLYAWTDSTVALWWINGTGNYKQFVANRVAKIQAHSDVQWRYIPTAENPADLGSRGGKLTQLWLNGPTWLDDKDNWPAEFIVKSSAEAQTEARPIKELLAVANNSELPELTIPEQLLEKFYWKKMLRIIAWVRRYLKKLTLIQGSTPASAVDS